MRHRTFAAALVLASLAGLLALGAVASAAWRERTDGVSVEVSVETAAGAGASAAWSGPALD